MNRIQLRIYEPPAEATEDVTPPEAEERWILPFSSSEKTTIISGRITPPAERARIIRENSFCPECSSCTVEPLELRDAILSPRNRQPIPGTATIVGFHCENCGTEWPVYELTSRRPG